MRQEAYSTFSTLKFDPLLAEYIQIIVGLAGDNQRNIYEICFNHMHNVICFLMIQREHIHTQTHTLTLDRHKLYKNIFVAIYDP